MTDLTIAVPRGATFEGTLDALDRLGVDTAEIRSNARKLLFEDAGLITMRPSDVPTYVEAGAADVGITGKDVLMEQAERDVYELLDLGYGRCRMVLATVAGEDLAAEALRRLGVMRIAWRIRGRRALLRVHRPPGRDRRGQGLGGAGAARRPGRGHRRSATGVTARAERPRRARGDRPVHGPPDRQPRGAQAQGDGDRRRAGAPAVSDVAAQVTAIVERVRAEGDAAVLALTRELDTGGAEPWPLRVDALQPRRRRRPSDPLREALELAAANVRAVALASLGADQDVPLPQGQTVTVREIPVSRAAIYVPGGARPTPARS